MRLSATPAIALALTLGAAVTTLDAPRARAQDAAASALELLRLRDDIRAVGVQVHKRGETLDAIQREIKAAGEELAALKERAAAFDAQVMLANAFLVSPPPPSDALGVAKTPVFDPHLHVDAVRRHDTLFLKLRRIEPGGVKLVADLELPASDTSIALPVDRNGALYVLEWSTTEGFAYSLSLRDGVGEQTLSSLQVRALLNQGRFLFVGSRLE